mmetsp:Transcript_16325/g.35430  ORF Transcript_16325/g.35430 Transcript_16325/m.35430 type:complete len:80 (+) Transcript_16325:97-336(+)
MISAIAEAQHSQSKRDEAADDEQDVGNVARFAGKAGGERKRRDEQLEQRAEICPAKEKEQPDEALRPVELAEDEKETEY